MRASTVGSTNRAPGVGPGPITAISHSRSRYGNRLEETVKEQGDSLRALDRLMARAAKALATLPSRWPVRGSVNSEFGRRPSPWTQSVEFHSGIDIKAQMGTPVHAPAAGTVVVAGPAHEYGTAVMLDHGQNIKTLYGHLSKVSVRHTLGREGLEWYLHAFAYRLPTLYGLATVAIAVGAGLLASAALRKTTTSA